MADPGVKAMPHRQVRVRVNAPVDEGIAPLVEALSRFHGVYTGSSCQGYASPGEEAMAVVTFAYAPNDPAQVRYSDEALSQDPADFAVALGGELLAAVEDDAELSVSYSHRPPMLTLAVRETAVQGVARALRDIAANVEKLEF